MFYPRSPFSKYPDLVQHIRPQFEQHGKQLSNLLEWLCLTPPTTTIRVNTLNTEPEKLRSAIEANVLTVAAASNQPPPIVRIHPKLPELITIGYDGQQSTVASSILPIADLGEVIVDVACGASILRGAHLYAPGVLAMPAHTALGERVNIYADVDGTCKRGTNTAVYASERKVFVGVGLVRMRRFQLFGANLEPSGIAVEVQQTRSGVPAIGDRFFPAGTAMLQNLPSIVCARVLDPQPGETVLDMCAAPGNKTTHLAELMGDRGRLIALDKTPNKLRLLQDKVDTFGVRSVRCYAYDSTKAVREEVGSAVPEAIVATGDCDDEVLRPPFEPATFDRILLDAPCSALGNRPQLRNDMSTRMLASYVVVQKKLWRTAVELLRPGGVLVYSTCTVAVAENEGMVAWALQKFAGRIELVPAEPLMGGPGWSGCGLSEEQRFFVQRFGPEDNDVMDNQNGKTIHADLDYQDTVGFFIAKFKKTVNI